MWKCDDVRCDEEEIRSRSHVQFDALMSHVQFVEKIPKEALSTLDFTKIL
jgi:hypothetical protein